MNYEERYNQALKRAEVEQETFFNLGNVSAKTAIERIFPELRESEDEKIRKEIIEYLKGFIPHHDDNLVAKSKVWIAWLEKQGEQKSWGEEDEKMLISALWHVSNSASNGKSTDYQCEVTDWLKSLKPQSHWKPSEKQMEALNAINNVGELSYAGQADLLIKLYNDLKTL